MQIKMGVQSAVQCDDTVKFYGGKCNLFAKLCIVIITLAVAERSDKVIVVTQ